MPRETKRGREKKWENEPRAFDYAGLEPIGVVQNTERTILENRKLSINYRNARAVDCDLLSLSGYSWYRWLAGSPIRWLVATRGSRIRSTDRVGRVIAFTQLRNRRSRRLLIIERMSVIVSRNTVLATTDGGCLVAVRITPRLTPPRRIASQDISYELLLGITAIFFRGACFSRKTCSWLFVTHAAAGNLSMYTEGEARDYPHPSRGFYMSVADSHDATD